MAGSATLWLEQQVLGHTLGFSTLARPATSFLVLCAALPPPTAATPGVEVTAGGYARQPAAWALTATPNVAANTATIAFPAATANWGTIGFFEIWDAPTGGNRYYWGPLVDPSDGVTPITRTIYSADIVRFSAGVIEVTAT